MDFIAELAKKDPLSLAIFAIVILALFMLTGAWLGIKVVERQRRSDEAKQDDDKAQNQLIFKALDLIGSLSGELKSLTHEMSTANQLNAAARETEQERIKTDKATDEKRIAALDANTEGLKQSIESISLLGRNLTKYIDTTEERRTAIGEIVSAAHDKSVNALREKIDSAVENNLKNIHAKLTELATAVSTVQDDLKETLKRIDTIKFEVEKTPADIKAINETLGALKESAEATKTTMGELAKEVHDISDELAELNKPPAGMAPTLPEEPPKP